MGFILIAVLLGSAYLCLQLYYVYYWLKKPEVIVPAEFIPSLKITVVVVAHNEEESIESCIEGIVKQHYSQELFEIIVIDDRSSDGTVELIKKMQSPLVRIFQLTDYPEFIHPPAYKKSAIELAISMAQHDWIVLTDADCIPPAEWLRNIAYAQSITDAVFLAAPISYSSGHTMLEKMQEMEMSVLMLITAAGIRSGLHDMANGANMSFSKQAFLDVKGYEGNYQYASGDDMFLIEKMRYAFPDRIAFVKSGNAIVETLPKNDWSSLIKQRLRWAGKNKGLKNPVFRNIWFFIGCYHVSIIIALVSGIYKLSSWWPFFILIIVKWIVDSLIIYYSSNFFRTRLSFLDYFRMHIVYMFYILRIGWNLILGRKGDWY
ncbi:MAG: glycosyltransferase [Saprospiraceae bacterium]|uniref:Glycosyltransferase n=1 Tax=Candidatus Opimibacter skivensis TaxID=2982028 RepID=A0A9D7SUR5_9BACT|nr:glycosyltransferase [Candidatus Opimibacter skivensis]